MKIALLIAGTVAFLALAYAFSLDDKGNSTQNTTEGIVFFTGTWKEALAKSKAENKPIFLDLYASWCGPCKMLKSKTFADKSCGEFFNPNFINVQLDGERGDGLALATDFRLTAYPSLYIIDTSGAVILHATGFKSPKELIDFGKQGLAKDTDR